MRMDKKKYYLFQIDVVFLNIVCTLLLVFMLALTFFIDKNFIHVILNDINFGILLFLYLFYMFLHEIIHSIAYVLNGAKFDKIVYGIHLEHGVFCCLCKQNVSKRNILSSLMAPLFYIGVITYFISLIINNPYLLMLSIFNISGCAGDIMMFIYISKLNHDIEFTELDDPISFAIYSDSDASKIKHIGLHYVECVSRVKREDLKKVNISKFSYVCMFFFLFLCIFYMILL